MYRGEEETGGGKTKCKNGQIEIGGGSYAKVDPQVWKRHKEEEAIKKVRG
jgi:hypothetical protein